MDDSFIDCLRCPIDPARSAILARDSRGFVCAGCGVVFPIKHPLPALVVEDAILPERVRALEQLPCRRP